jgi:hypothetical protein
VVTQLGRNDCSLNIYRFRMEREDRQEFPSPGTGRSLPPNGSARYCSTTLLLSTEADSFRNLTPARHNHNPTRDRRNFCGAANPPRGGKSVRMKNGFLRLSNPSRILGR